MTIIHISSDISRLRLHITQVAHQATSYPGLCIMKWLGVIGQVKTIKSENQTWKTMFDLISKHREESWKYNMQQSIFDELWGVWNCGQTLPLVFDISSQWNLTKLRRKWRKKIVKMRLLRSDILTLSHS